MANKERKLLLIQELIDLTKQGVLQWDRTVQPDSYIAAFPNSAVRVSWQAPIGDASYMLQLIDGYGDVTETISGTQLRVRGPAPSELNPNEVYGPLAELYQEVQRVVERKNDKTIDDLFSELKRLRRETTQAS